MFDSGDTILIIGLGRSGQASAQVLRARGARVVAVDEKPREQLQQAIAYVESLGAVFIEPAALPSVERELTLAVLSPGVPLNGPLVRAVQNANVPVYSEIEVAYRLCKAPVVAVTGTKGKSTTTSLVGHLLRTAGKEVRVGGNIGNPLIAEVGGTAPDQWVVAEVSSFQLEAIRSFHPRISVILNISPDHLDRYFSIDEYAEAKYRIFANQSERDFFIGNLDDPRVAELHWLKTSAEVRVHARQLWFTLAQAHRDASMYVQRGVITYAPFRGDPRPVEIMPVAEIPLAGPHNVCNVMAALLAALAADCDPVQLRQGVRSFSAMAHRLQPVATIGGVLFVDDSKATNPGSVIAALQSYDRPIVLIAGGKSKNTDFTELGRAIDARVKTLVTIGETAEELAAHVYRTPIEPAVSMEDAVQRAARHAAPGAVVLLSPACASFDMFASAEDRGTQFIAAVHGLTDHSPSGAGR
ncbi:MAG: UDP-N-acetylmuramoyl-L-alanine--D-glutamate ligase [Candidatus Baltobacteraceae bacterium]